VPEVQLITGPVYFVSSSDTLGMVHQDSPVPTTRAIIGMIQSTKDKTAAQMRKLCGPLERGNFRGPVFAAFKVEGSIQY